MNEQRCPSVCEHTVHTNKKNMIWYDMIVTACEWMVYLHMKGAFSVREGREDTHSSYKEIQTEHILCFGNSQLTELHFSEKNTLIVVVWTGRKDMRSAP